MAYSEVLANRIRAMPSTAGGRLNASESLIKPVAMGPAQHQVSAARWIASRKLPNRRRIVFSDGRIAASVQLSAVGSEPCSATNLRRAATDSAIRVSVTSGSGTASPSNTPGGFVLWELRSTKSNRGTGADHRFVVTRGHALRHDHPPCIQHQFAHLAHVNCRQAHIHPVITQV